MKTIITHPFFHKMQNTDQPVAEELDATAFDDFPSLFEIYRNVEEVIIEEKVKPVEEQERDFEATIAYHLEQRFIVIQDKDTLNCARYNLIAAKQISEYAYARWWYFREMKDTRKGRETMQRSGIYIPRNHK